MTIASVNPTTGKTLKTYQALSSEGIASALSQAQAAFSDYAKTTFEQRQRWMHKAADILLERKEDFGAIMTLEMGKTLKSAPGAAATTRMSPRAFCAMSLLRPMPVIATCGSYLWALCSL